MIAWFNQHREVIMAAFVFLLAIAVCLELTRPDDNPRRDWR
jgi:hypothetical protein